MITHQKGLGNSQPSQASNDRLQDQDTDDDIYEVEASDDDKKGGAEPEGEVEADDMSIPSQTSSHTPVVGTEEKIRAFIRPDTIKVLEASGDCSRAITRIFRRGVDKEYVTWGKVPLSRKDEYFEEFRKSFIWDKDEETAIRGGWDVKATEKFAQFTWVVRNAPKRPKFILENVYTEWKRQWDNDPKYKLRCDKILANCGRASTHNAGFRSFANSVDHLIKELKLDRIPAHTLFKHNHSKKRKDETVQWTSSKAMRVEEEYQREILKQNKEKAESGTPIDEDAAYLKAAGGITKSGVYGVDKTLYYGSTGSSSSGSRRSSGSSIVSEVEQLREWLRIEKAKRENIEKALARRQGNDEQG